MKIKKISILGFKSFMDRLEITFPMGISGIVGPNGCGKSNIVDAIRWGMGEQSPKQLRGRRMEDVIFSGAGDYGPLGMAEVSMIFENGDGMFPSAFATETEVAVTRRLYRSGESEYRINNVPCRLKDIQEIFMDTGLGNRPYSIISQGQIGTILEQKPEETRSMLEEAAGITKYKKKVEASQRKIELTESNLQRVEDILGEVQRQIRSLKRQASKAKRYKVICEKIQNLELILYCNTYNQLKEESGNSLRSTEDLVQKEIAKSTEFSHLHAQIETMNLELEEKDTSLSTVRKGHLHLRERVHKKETDLDSLTGEIRMQEELESRLRIEQEDINDRLINLKEEEQSLQKEIGKLRMRSGELKSEESLKEKRLKKRQELLKKIKEDYEKARAELSEGANREVGISHKSDYLNRMLDQITDSRSRLERELKEINERIENVIKASERKGLAREATANSLREIEASIEQQKLNSEELELTRKNVEMELKSAEADLNVCQSRLASLKTLTENFEGYKMGVRTIMKSKDLEPKRQGRILGLVADIIQVEPKYEQAVEAVLADDLQHIIVESQKDGKQAVEYLKKKVKGRGSFIPLKDLSRNRKNQIKDLQFPCLLDFVSVPETYRPIIEELLRDTVLAENLDAAISAWKNIVESPTWNGSGMCFVTIDGDIVDERGVISGGKLVQSSRGLLSRKRELVELKKKSVSYQKKVDDLKLKLEGIITEIEQKKKELEAFTEDKWSYQEEINEFDKMIFRFGEEMDQLEKQKKRISEGLERKTKEQGKHKEELLMIEEELRQFKVKHQEEEKYFRKKEFELKECEEEFDQFRDELVKLKTDYRIIEEEQRSFAREIERLDDYANDSLERQQKIEKDIALGRARCDECQKRKEILKEELKKLYDNLRKAEDDMNRADQDRQEFQNSIKEEERKAEQLRGEIEALKEEISTAKMEHSEINFKMNNLVEVVKEKFSLNLYDIYEKYLDEGFSKTETEEKLEYQKNLRQGLGEVNLVAIKEHEALKERYEFIKNQREDLINSIESLQLAIIKINRTSLDKFKKTFQEVDRKLKEVFPILFGGGTAGLRLTDETKPLESGVLVEAQLPGKRLSHMGLLSGGEKALVAMAFIFAIYMIKPSPFCLLDEVDAPLDEANIDRFNNLLNEIKRASQIIMVTHSRRTMEIVDRLYGITMEKSGVSKIVSVDIESMTQQ